MVFLLNEKGQQEAFDFLVQAIIGAAIIAIIIGIVGYLDDLRVQASLKSFDDGFKSALNSPTGEIIKVSSIVLPNSVITSRSLSLRFNIQDGCTSFQPNPRISAFRTSEGSDVLFVEQRVETNVFIKCVLGSSLASTGTGCEKSCAIGIGIQP